MSAKSPKPTTTTTKTGLATSPKKSTSVVKAPPAKSPALASPVKRTAGQVTDVKPKKAASAYFIWMNEVGRKEIIAKQFGGNGSKVTEIMKAAGAMWSSMSDADKKQWNEKAEKDKARHSKEMESYVPSETSEPKKKKGKKGKKEKDPNKPKRGLSAYMFFGKEVRADVIAKECNGNGSKVTEVMKGIAARWAKLDAKDKEKFERLSAQDKERYEKEIAEYKKNSGGDDDDDDDEEDEE
jgi:hypothetical protein